MITQFTRRTVLAAGIAGGGLGTGGLVASQSYRESVGQPSILALTEGGDVGRRFVEGIRREAPMRAFAEVDVPTSGIVDYDGIARGFAKADIILGLTDDASYLMIMEMCRAAGAHSYYEGIHVLFAGAHSRHDISASFPMGAVGRSLADALSCGGLSHRLIERFGSATHRGTKDFGTASLAGPIVEHDGDWIIALGSSYLHAVTSRAPNALALGPIARGAFSAEDAGTVLRSFALVKSGIV